MLVTRTFLIAWSCWTALAGGGIAAAAELGYPLSIAVNDQGVVYLADRKLPGIWKIEQGELSLVLEGSRKFRTPLNAIRCLAIDRDGRILAGDSATRDVYRLNDQGPPTGLTQTAAPAAGGEEKTAAAAPAKIVLGQIGIPMDIAVDSAGDLYVSDLELSRIVKVAKGGGPANEWVSIPAPRGICLDAEQHLWVISGRTLVRVSPAGEKQTIVAEGTFSFPHTVAVSPDKTAFVCDGYEKCVWKIAVGGKPEKLVAGDPLQNPVGMRLVGDKLFVVDPRAMSVFQITLDGKLSKVDFQPKAAK